MFIIKYSKKKQKNMCVIAAQSLIVTALYVTTHKPKV